MAQCVCSKLSSTNTLVLGTIQILLGIFHVFMWYFQVVLFMGQIRGVFGIYESITLRTGCTLWGIFFIMSGAVLIKLAKHPTPQLIIIALILNITCIITIIVAVILTLVELSSFRSVSYRNFGQARLGRLVSFLLLISYSLQFVIALTYSIFGCIGLAVQIVSGLICFLLGILWSYLLVSHDILFQSYHPVLSMTGYTFWASIIFLFSGLFSIIIERSRSTKLVCCTIAVNIISASIAIIGLFLLTAEFIINLKPGASLYWPQRCGKILSQYLFIFITLEFIVACIVTHWSCQAGCRR